MGAHCLQSPLLLHDWLTGEVIGLVDKLVHEGEHESSGQFFYDELPVLATAALIKSDVRLCGIDDKIAGTR